MDFTVGADAGGRGVDPVGQRVPEYALPGRDGADEVTGGVGVAEVDGRRFECRPEVLSGPVRGRYSLSLQFVARANGPGHGVAGADDVQPEAVTGLPERRHGVEVVDAEAGPERHRGGPARDRLLALVGKGFRVALDGCLAGGVDADRFGPLEGALLPPARREHPHLVGEVDAL